MLGLALDLITYLLNMVDLLCYVICVWNNSWKNSHDTRRGILAVMKCRFEKHIEDLVTSFLGYYTFLHVLDFIRTYGHSAQVEVVSVRHTLHISHIN